MTIQEYYTHRHDHAFLYLITFDNEALKEIIYEALNIKVEYAKIINSKMAKRRLIGRANYLDLVVETDIGFINIEVSNDSYNKYSAHRNFIYLTALISNIIKTGIKLKDMPKVYQINLIFGESNDVDISRYKMHSKDEKKVLTRKFQILNVYMDKLKEIYYASNKKLIDKLLLVGMSMTREELEENKEENIVFKELLERLDKMEDTEIAPELMPAEEENKWYREMLIESAKEEGHDIGFKEGKRQKEIEVISSMLKEKIDISLISKITGLSLERIKEIL